MEYDVITDDTFASFVYVKNNSILLYVRFHRDTFSSSLDIRLVLDRFDAYTCINRIKLKTRFVLTKH